MAQTKVKLISDGVIVQGNLHSSHGITTAHIGEGSNLYYTDARVGSYLSTNSFATESYVGTQITNLVDSSPATLNTLNELAAALGDDPNFATTTATSIGLKAPLAGPSFTGVPSFSLNDGTFIKAVNATNNVASTNVWGYGLYEGGSKLAEISLVRDGSSNQMYIGTTSAHQTLRIGTANKVTALTIDASQNATFAGNVTTPYIKSTASGNLALGGASGISRIQSNASNDIRFLNSSNQDLLTLVASTRGANFAGSAFLFGAASSVSSYIRLGGENVAGGRLYLEYNGDSSYIDSYGGHGSTERYRDLAINARNLTFKTGAGNSVTEKLTINSSGNATFAGDVYTTGTSNSNVVISRDNMYIDAGQLYIGADDATTDDTFRQKTASGSYFIESRKSGTWTNRLQINTAGTLIGSQGATFAGEITSGDDINVNNGKLVVNHTSAEVRVKSSSDTGESYISFSDPSDINPGQIYYGHSNNAMVFRTNDGERMRITSGGDIGIGTTSPANKLDVQISTGNRTTLEPVMSVSANGSGPYTGFGPKICFSSEE